MLAIQHVSKVFSNDKKALEEVSFKCKNKEIIGLLGTSGCGKSTLLRIISGLEQPTTGSVSINNTEITGINDACGFIFQEPRLMPWLTVIENVTFGLKGDKYEAKKQALQFIKLVGLEGFEKLYPRELSGGMAQRVAIARSLVTSPQLLLLDEPFSALDAFTKMQLQDVLLDVWEQCQSTIVLVTHDIDEALYLCDRLLILRGQPGELIEEVQVTQERPRARGDVELAQLKTHILDLLHLNKAR